MSKFSVYPVRSRHIGSSSTWLGELIQQMRESDDTSLDVPCGTCNACCHGPPVTITDEELGRYSYQTAANERGQRQLVQTQDGGCVYLDDGGRCGIHTSRPNTCREFDCRAYALSRTHASGWCRLNEGIQQWDITPQTRRDADTTAAIQLGVRLFGQRDSRAAPDQSIILTLLAADELRAAVNAERSGDDDKYKDAIRHVLAKWMPLITER